MSRVDCRFIGILLAAALALALTPADALSGGKGKGKGKGKTFTIVTGTITTIVDNGDGTATATFTKTNSGKSAGSIDVTLDDTTRILLNDEGPTALADFITAVQAAIDALADDPTAAQYSGSARIENGASAASRVSVSNIEPE